MASLNESLIHSPPLPNPITFQATEKSYLVAYLPLCALFTGLLHYIFSASTKTSEWRNNGGHPPLVPYKIPFFGTLPIQMLWDPVQYIVSSRYFFRLSHPVRVNLLGRTYYFNQGPPNVALLLNNKYLSASFLHSTVVRLAFRGPPAACEVYDKDDSGPFATPFSGSKVEPRNRVGYLARTSFHRLLTGSGLKPLCKRFERNLQDRVKALDVGKDWYQMDNFLDLFEQRLAPALIDAMYGPALLRDNPDFMKNFWIFDRSMKVFLGRIPRFLARKAHKARDEAFAAIRRWHSWATQNFDESSIDADGTDPYWGGEFCRERQKFFAKMDGHEDPDAQAGTDIAFLWAANTNTIMSMFWCAFEIYRDPQLLRDIRLEAESCIISRSADGKEVEFDTDALVRQPLLQAVFIETLRLRVHGFILRYPSTQDLQVNEWTFPKKNIVLTCATTAHLNPDIWSTTQRGSRPANVFWPSRFLKQTQDGKVEFTLEGTEGSFVAFGGGVHACPGRHFAKREVLRTIALLVTLFDVEVMDERGAMEMSAVKFGFGLLGPTGKVPARMRRR